MQKGAWSSQKFGSGARSKRKYQGARGKSKREQGTKINEKGAVKLVKKGASAEKWKGTGIRV